MVDKSDVFTDSALWAGSVCQSQCLSVVRECVCVCVCVSVPPHNFFFSFLFLMIVCIINFWERFLVVANQPTGELPAYWGVSMGRVCGCGCWWQVTRRCDTWHLSHDFVCLFLSVSVCFGIGAAVRTHQEKQCLPFDLLHAHAKYHFFFVKLHKLTILGSMFSNSGSVCNFWCFLPITISLKLNSYHFAFLMT